MFLHAVHQNRLSWFSRANMHFVPCDGRVRLAGLPASRAGCDHSGLHGWHRRCSAPPYRGRENDTLGVGSIASLRARPSVRALLSLTVSRYASSFTFVSLLVRERAKRGSTRCDGRLMTNRQERSRRRFVVPCWRGTKGC